MTRNEKITIKSTNPSDVSRTAGLLKGFAFTTVIGLTLGILITRPAFADIVRLLGKENAS